MVLCDWYFIFCVQNFSLFLYHINKARMEQNGTIGSEYVLVFYISVHLNEFKYEQKTYHISVFQFKLWHIGLLQNETFKVVISANVNDKGLQLMKKRNVFSFTEN